MSTGQRRAERETVSHHYSGPNITFPRGDARLDFTDLYAFPKPGRLTATDHSRLRRLVTQR
jgi:hypothetical protein